MSDHMKTAAVIPARMASSRLPGKPLLDIRGLPVVEHVRRRALLCKEFSEVAVATCDSEIASVVQGYGGKALMTSPSHPGALDRVAEAIEYLDCTHVVNVQGDEVLVLPEDLDLMVRAMVADPVTAAWNGVGRIEDAEVLRDPSIVKLIVSRSNRVLFCTRNLTHVPLTKPFFEPVRLSVGVMGYSRPFLKRYQTMNRTPLEMAESIDQSRIIEYDETMRVVEFSRWYPGINEHHEVALVEKYLDEDSRQKRVLEEILQL
jgi:3-deoxy-manno-octulosonate cytidylyltransferase (CMP-KDO synthetase)